MLAFFYAISITPLAEVIALSFAAPIFATLLAIFIFREKVSTYKMDGNIVWFCGYCRHPSPRLVRHFLGPYTGTNGRDDVGQRSYHYKNP